jgi:hypothetical protein
MSNTFTNFVSEINTGERKAKDGMEVFPIFVGTDSGLQYVTLKEALDQNWIRVTELTDSGSVPELKVINRSDHLVLLLDGEELTGAKQNRVLNASVLLNTNSETVIPVSCTEQGRWSYRSGEFADSGLVMASKARSRKALAVMASLDKQRGFASDQSEVWQDISAMHTKAGVRLATGAMKDIYTSTAEELNAYAQAFSRVPDQQGILVAVGGKIVGVDLVANKRAYSILHDKLIKSYAMEPFSAARQLQAFPRPKYSTSFKT